MGGDGFTHTHSLYAGRSVGLRVDWIGWDGMGGLGRGSDHAKDNLPGRATTDSPGHQQTSLLVTELMSPYHLGRDVTLEELVFGLVPGCPL